MPPFDVEVTRSITTTVRVDADSAQAAQKDVNRRDFKLPPRDEWAVRRKTGRSWSTTRRAANWAAITETATTTPTNQTPATSPATDPKGREKPQLSDGTAAPVDVQTEQRAMYVANGESGPAGLGRIGEQNRSTARTPTRATSSTPPGK